MISIEFNKGLPLEYESFLVEKYESYKITCRYIEIYYPNYEFNYMLVFENGKIVELLICGNKGNTSTYFNAFASVDRETVKLFVKIIFEKFPEVDKVYIPDSYIAYGFKKSFLISATDDYILNLPPKMNDYYFQLGARTRKSIKSVNHKFSNDFPQVNFFTVYGDDIKKDVVAKIIQLNIDRMKHKGVMPGKNTDDIEYIYKFVRHYGCVTYVEIDGAIAAGNISYILKTRIFGYVTAHDDKYSVYNLGRMCRLKVIQTSIDKGLSTFHLLWGNGEYKMKLLAMPQPLFTNVIYREYSFDFIIELLKIITLRGLIALKQSKLTKPIRNAIKLYRKKKWNTVASFLAQIFILNSVL